MIMLVCSQDLKPQAYRNAYDIPRRNLLDQVTRMRSNLLRTSQKLIRGQDEGIKSHDSGNFYRKCDVIC